MPFLFLGTLATAFSRPLVLTFALAVLASMVVAFTLTPTLAILLLRGAAQSADEPVRALGRASVRPWICVVPAPQPRVDRRGVLVVAALAMIPQLGHGSLLPALQDRNLLLQVQAAPGTSLTEMDRITARRPGTAEPARRKSVGTHVGRAVTSDQLADVNSAEVWITLTRAADYAQTQAAIRTVMRGYPGLRTDLVTYPSDRVARCRDQGRPGRPRLRADLVLLQRRRARCGQPSPSVRGGADRAPDPATADG